MLKRVHLHIGRGSYLEVHALPRVRRHSALGSGGLRAPIAYSEVNFNCLRVNNNSYSTVYNNDYHLFSVLV